MGTAPVESETPVDISELLVETQLAIKLYNYLPDIWAGGMQPFYVGKDYNNLKFFMELLNVEKGAYLYILDTLRELDIKNAASINGKIKQQNKAKKR